MGSIDKHISDARRWLMYPNPTPSDSTLAEFGIEVIDQKVTELNQTAEPWFLLSRQITTEPGVATYRLDNIPNFGKARYLYTAPDFDGQFDREPIPLVSMETLTAWFNGGDVTGELPSSWWAAYPTAAAAYYLNGVNVLEVGPTPMDARSLTLIYEPSVVRPTARTQGFRLDQFDSLIALLMARRSVLYCEWTGLSDAKTDKRRSDIVGLINAELGSAVTRTGLEYLFWQFKNRAMANTTTETIGFGVW